MTGFVGGIAASAADGNDVLTYALDAGSSSGRTVIAIIMATSSTHTTSATYGGTSMTSMGAEFQWASSAWWTQAFYLKNAASGSNNVVATFGSTTGSKYSHAMAYSDTDTTTPITNIANALTAANTSITSGSLTSATDKQAIMFGQAYDSSGGTLTPGTGVTADYASVGSTIVYGYSLRKDGAASVTVDATLTNISYWAGVGFSLNSATSADMLLAQACL